VTTLVKTFIVFVKSNHVREAVIFFNQETKELNDVSVIIGATYGKTGEEAVERVARNYELPTSILTYQEVC
jgi:hypothetical protein